MPFTVIVNCAPPAVVEVGEMEVVVGTAWPGWRASVTAWPASASTTEGIVDVFVPVAPALA